MLQKHQENSKMVRKKFEKYAYSVLYICELMSFLFRCNAAKSEVGNSLLNTTVAYPQDDTRMWTK